MGRNTIKRKQLRRKFKRRAAALAGAAILTGTALSGIPVTKALAAEAPSSHPSTKTEQSQRVTPPGRGWHEHKYSWPGVNDNKIWSEDGKIYYRSDKPRDQYRTSYVYQWNSPVNYVKSSASVYGFNASLDEFNLLTISSKRALVEVRRHDTGKLYNVLLERTYDREWKIVDVRAL